MTLKNKPKLKTLLALISFIAMGGIMYHFYDSMFFYPLKMFIVGLHESSHAIAGLITGGSIESFTMLPNEGGSVVVKGGNIPIMAMSGYLGSLLIGIGLFYFSSKSNKDRYAFLIISLWVLLFTLFSFSDLFTLFFGLISFVVLISIYFIKSNFLHDTSLKIIGMFSIIYVPQDIFSDTIKRSHLKSDASLMSDFIGLSSETWGWIWLFISLIFIAYGLVLIAKATYKENKRNADCENDISPL